MVSCSVLGGHTTRRARTLVVAGFVVLAVVAAGILTSRPDAPARRPAAVHAPSPGTQPHGRTVDVPVAATPGRPNILVVMLDDMRSDEMRFAPNARRYVRERGLDFRNSFSPYPLCCPARASFLLGKYAHNHGVLFHDAPYGFGSLDDHLTIAGRLQAAGYRTALVGKYLNHYGLDRSPGTHVRAFGCVGPARRLHLDAPSSTFTLKLTIAAMAFASACRRWCVPIARRYRDKM